MSYAHLDRDVVVVGVDTRFEIWDQATWDAYVAEQEAASLWGRDRAALRICEARRAAAVGGHHVQ